jgi:hypothetical protein
MENTEEKSIYPPPPLTEGYMPQQQQPYMFTPEQQQPCTFTPEQQP